jgi:hypothetical protein
MRPSVIVAERPVNQLRALYAKLNDQIRVTAKYAMNGQHGQHNPRSFGTTVPVSWLETPDCSKSPAAAKPQRPTMGGHLFEDAGAHVELSTLDQVLRHVQLGSHHAIAGE